AKTQRLIVDAEGGSAELVGGTEVDAVDLAMLWDGIEVNDAGQQDQGQSSVRERTGEQAEATDATLLALPRQECEPEIVVARLGCAPERHAIPRKAGHEVGSAVLHEFRRETRGVGEGLRGRPRAVD